MSSENKYSVTILAKSGDRVLTKVLYPDQSYSELVQAQAIISDAMIKAGFARAILKGEDIPAGWLERYGLD